MILRKFKNSDASQIALLINNKKILDNLMDYISNPYTLKDAEEFIEICQSEKPQKTFVVDHEGEAIGVISLEPQKDIFKKNAELGYWLGEPYWNKGFITEAVRLIIDYGFTELDLNRIYASVFEHNHASKRVLGKSGFDFEGVFKKSITKNEVILDVYRYSILNEITVVIGE